MTAPKTTMLDYAHWTARAEAAAQRVSVLLVVAGSQPGLIVPLDRDVMSVGRAPECDIRLDDRGLSRIHMEVRRGIGNEWRLHDSGSTNGVWVNGDRVRQHLLQDDDRIALASDTVLRFARIERDEIDALSRRYQESILDALTGVYNRRYLFETLTQELAYAARHDELLCVLLMDLDKFKSINDRFGHLNGDRVLKEIAKRTQNHLRTEDVLARYGGEEFAVILRGLDTPAARDSAERVRQLIESLRIRVSGVMAPVTVSIGIASHRSLDESTPQTLVDAADRCLYEAKARGGNCTVVYGGIGPGLITE